MVKGAKTCYAKTLNAKTSYFLPKKSAFHAKNFLTTNFLATNFIA